MSTMKAYELNEFNELGSPYFVYFVYFVSSLGFKSGKSRVDVRPDWRSSL
jgi:hypothetical protein